LPSALQLTLKRLVRATDTGVIASARNHRTLHSVRHVALYAVTKLREVRWDSGTSLDFVGSLGHIWQDTPENALDFMSTFLNDGTWFTTRLSLSDPASDPVMWLHEQIVKTLARTKTKKKTMSSRD